jgi:hypothetical protein
MQAGPAQKRQPLWAGLSLVALGLAVMAGRVISPEGLNAPFWVAAVAVSAFIFAGISLTAHTLGIGWLNTLANIAVVGALATPGFWILLDPGPKVCSGGFGLFASGAGGGWFGAAGELDCRLAFGAGAIVTALIAVALIVSAWRRVLGRRHRPR